MPKSKTIARSSASSNGAAPAEPAEPTVTLCDRADGLYRAAAECCRQHKRYACFIDHAVPDGEQEAGFRMVRLADELLTQAAAEYEAACGDDAGHGDDAWWHRANGLWHATREYLRRHSVADRDSRRVTAMHDRSQLARLALEYDLEASALMALRLAAEAYHKVRPDADLCAPASPAR